MAVTVQCDNCGARLSLKDESRLGQKMKCPKCQTTFIAEEDFSGAPSPKKSPSGKGKAGKSKKSKKSKGKKKSGGGFPVLPVVLGSVVLLALIGVGIWFAFSGGGDVPVADSSENGEGVEADAASPEATAPDTATQPGESESVATNGTNEAETKSPDETTQPSGPPGVVNTQWMPENSLVVMQFKPASAMNSALLKPFIENPLVKQMLEEYEKQQGTRLADLESMTVGVGMDLEKLGSDEGGPGPMGMLSGGGALPQIVSVMRLNSEMDDAKVAKLAETIKENQRKQQQAMAQAMQGNNGAYGSGSYPPEGYPDSAMQMETYEMEAMSSEPDGYPEAMSSEPGMSGPPGSGESSESEEKKPAPKVYSLAISQSRPGTPQMPPFGMSLVDSKTLVFAPETQLKKMVAEKPTNPAGKFRYVQHDGDIVFAARLDFVPQLKNLFEQVDRSGGPASELFSMYDEGARGIAFSLKFTDGADIQLTVSGKDSESADKLQPKVQSLLETIQGGISQETKKLPKSIREPINQFVQGMTVEKSDAFVTLAMPVRPELIEAGKKRLMSQATGGLMSGLGDLFGPGAPREPLGGAPQTAEKSSGLLEETELLAVANWSSRPIPPLPEARKVEKLEQPAPRGRGRGRGPQGSEGPGTESPGGSEPIGAGADPTIMNLENSRPDRAALTGGRLPGSISPGPAARSSNPPGQPGAEMANTQMAPPGQSGGRRPRSEPQEPAGPEEKVFELALVVTGVDVSRVVQYQDAVLTVAKDNEGRDLKRRTSISVPYSTSEMWSDLVAVMLEQTGDEGVKIPVLFDLPAKDVTSLSEVSGEIMVRVSEDRSEIRIESSDPNELPVTELAAAGVTATAGTDGTIYLVPENQGVVLVGLKPAPPEPSKGPGVSPFGLGMGLAGFANPFGGGPGMGNPQMGMSPGAYGTEMSGAPGGFDPSMEAEYAQMNRPGGEGDPYAEFGEGYPQGGGQGGGGAGADVKKLLGAGPPTPTRVSHLPTWNSPGFQLPPNKTGPWILTVARQPSEEKISFTFKNVPVPSGGADSARQGAWVADTVEEDLSEGITGAYASAQWAKTDGSEKRIPLHVWFDLVGPDAPNLMAVGSYTLDECVTDQDTSLILDNDNPMYTERPKGLDPVDPRFSGLFSPPDGARIDFTLSATDTNFTSLKSLKGSIRVMYSHGIKEVVVDSLGQYINKRISDTSLAAERVTPDLKYDNGVAAIVLPTTVRNKIVSIDLVDSEGRLYPAIPITLKQVDRDDYYSFAADEEILNSVGLRIALHQGLTNSTIPFSFENVPVPSPSVSE